MLFQKRYHLSQKWLIVFGKIQKLKQKCSEASHGPRLIFGNFNAASSDFSKWVEFKRLLRIEISKGASNSC